MKPISKIILTIALPVLMLGTTSCLDDEPLIDWSVIEPVIELADSDHAQYANNMERGDVAEFMIIVNYTASYASDVKENIEGHKDKADSFFAHIPSSLPPLEESYEIQKKLKKVGFDWPDAAGVVAKVEEELEEVNEAIAEGDEDHLEMELGDLLFSVVNLCRFMKIRPNVALHRCNEKVKVRFQRLFDLAAERGIPINKEHVDEMNDLWEEAKKEERIR